MPREGSTGVAAREVLRRGFGAGSWLAGFFLAQHNPHQLQRYSIMQYSAAIKYLVFPLLEFQEGEIGSLFSIAFLISITKITTVFLLHIMSLQAF